MSLFGDLKSLSTDQTSARNDFTHRILLFLAAVGLFGPALEAWGAIVQLPTVGGLTALCCIAVVIVICLVTTAPTGILGKLDLIVLALALLVLASWSASQLYFYPAYGTDEAAFVQYAAQLFLHGHDPYGHNLLPALTSFRVPIQFATYRLNGTIVSTLGYPALSFLMVIPAIWATHGVQSIIAENVALLALELVMVFALVPRHLRSIGVVLILGLPFLLGYSIGGVIMTMSLPFLLIVAARWTEAAALGRLTLTDITRATCLGLAASISPYAWFLAPFLLVSLFRLRAEQFGVPRSAKLLGGFAATALGTFAIINVPFLLRDPRTWLAGVTSPILQHAIPFGQGFIDATVFFHVGGGNLTDYTVAALCAMATLLALLFAFFDQLWRTTFVLPSLAFFFSTRSLSEYFTMMVALWFVSICSPGRGVYMRTDGPQKSSALEHLAPRLTRQQIPWFRWILVATPLLALLIVTGLALAARAPIALRVSSVETNGQFHSIWKVRATATNISPHALAPHFATDASGYLTTFWNVVSGPRRLNPGETASYILVAPNTGSMPSVTQPFELQAVTSSPDTVSSAPLFTPEHFQCYISPSYVNRLVPFGKAVNLKVELLSPFGSPVRMRGVRVAMGQIVYGQNALIPAEGEINGAAEGQTPVFALTNSRGVATFRVTDRTNQGGNPLYFQAYVSPRRNFPYGYSEIVTVKWTPQQRGENPHQ